jgi:hypothetical protein
MVLFNIERQNPSSGDDRQSLIASHGATNYRQPCWHTHCNTVCQLPFNLRCLLRRCVVKDTATWFVDGLWRFVAVN